MRQQRRSPGTPGPAPNKKRKLSRSLWLAGQAEGGQRKLSVVRVERERCPHADGAVKAATIAGGASGVKPAAGLVWQLRVPGRSWRGAASGGRAPGAPVELNVMVSFSFCLLRQGEGDHTAVSVALAQPARRPSQ